MDGWMEIGRYDEGEGTQWKKISIFIENEIFRAKQKQRIIIGKKR